jgi:hypothetical protein
MAGWLFGTFRDPVQWIREDLVAQAGQTEPRAVHLAPILSAAPTRRTDSTVTRAKQGNKTDSTSAAGSLTPESCPTPIRITESAEGPILAGPCQWTHDRCRALRSQGLVGEWLPVAFGGVHGSLPRWSSGALSNVVDLGGAVPAWPAVFSGGSQGVTRRVSWRSGRSTVRPCRPR